MQKLNIQISVEGDSAAVWDRFTNPKHIIEWYFASEDWCCPDASNDLRPEGKFSTRMEAKDGSTGFDFSGTYTKIDPHILIEYLLDDGREVCITFAVQNGKIHISQFFDPETENDPEFQRQGWQEILNNFKTYTESSI